MKNKLMKDKVQDEREKRQFLTAMGLVMEKYGIFWDDVTIDYDKGIIDIKTDLEPSVVARFLMNVQEKAGTFR